MDGRLDSRRPDWQQLVKQPGSPKQLQQRQQEIRITDCSSQENELIDLLKTSNSTKTAQLLDNNDKSDREQEQAQIATDSAINDDSKPKRNPFCSRCRNHGKIARVKGHKRHCEFKVCQCDGCKLVEFRQIVSAAQIKRRRYLKQDEECGRQIEITPPVLARANIDHEDPASLIAKSFTGSTITTTATTNSAINAVGTPLKHIHQHLVRPTTQQLLALGAQQQHQQLNNDLNNQHHHDKDLHDHQRQRLTQAQLQADLTDTPISVAAATAVAAVNSHQVQSSQNSNVYPLPFLEAIANHASESHLQKYHQLSHHHQQTIAGQDPSSVMQKLHPLGPLLHHHHNNSQEHHINATIASNGSNKQEQSATKSSPPLSSMVPTSSSAIATAINGSRSNFHLSTMLNQITGASSSSSSLSAPPTTATSTANSSSNSSTTSSTCSRNGSINQLPPTPTSANPTPMTSTAPTQLIHPNQTTTISSNTANTNDNFGNNNGRLASTYMDTLLMSSQREKLQLVDELHQRYGPLIVYSWLNAENFDLRKILNSIENSQHSFSDLMNNSRLKYHLNNSSSSNNSANNNTAINDSANNLITNIDNFASQLNNSVNFATSNNHSNINHHHHHQLPIHHHQNNHLNHQITNHNQYDPQIQSQQQPHRLTLNYPQSSTHPNIMPHFIDHILAQNVSQNQVRSAAQYNIGNLLHQDHYQLLQNHLNANTNSSSNINNSHQSSQLQMDITQALLNTSSSTSSLSTIL